MKTLVLAVLFAAFAPLLAMAQEPGEDPLAEYLWVARPAIIFADSPLDPRLVQQLAAFEERRAELDERDVVVIVDTERSSPLRTALRPRDFQFVLIGKEGQVIYRRPEPVTVREIIRLIDRTPLRQQEIGRS
ncbi:MAG: DUF4174 domain-containing protein [Rubricella sp.]